MPLVPQGAQLHVQLGADQGHRDTTTCALGVDVVRHELNHRQAEFGDYGLKGGFSFSNNTTGAAGYTSPRLQQLRRVPARPAVVLRRRTSRPIEMTGREWQSAVYVQRPLERERKLTVSRRPARSRTTR